MAQKISSFWVNSAQKLLSFRTFIIRILNYYPPTMAKYNNFLLVQWCLKFSGLRQLIIDIPINHFPTVCTISQRWPDYLCYLDIHSSEANFTIGVYILQFKVIEILF